MIRAVVFDFDGVILDTETAHFDAWAEIFREHDAELPIEEWIECVGTTQSLDNYELLAARARRAVGAREDIRTRQRQRAHELISASQVLPGVAQWMDDARVLGLELAIASNSQMGWLELYLEQFGLRDRFVHLSCFDGVCAGKPDPYLYAAACEAIGVAPSEAIAVEDSPDGVGAAVAAGLFCVAVPRGLTATVDLGAADVVVDSLADLSLAEAVALAEGEASNASPTRPR